MTYAARHQQLGIIARWRARRRRSGPIIPDLPVPGLANVPVQHPGVEHAWLLVRTVPANGRIYQFWRCSTCQTDDLIIHSPAGR